MFRVLGWFFSFFQTKKYDFNITKNCCEKKYGPNLLDFKNNNLKSSEVYNWFQQVAKNITAFLKFYTSICKQPIAKFGLVFFSSFFFLLMIASLITHHKFEKQKKKNTLELRSVIKLISIWTWFVNRVGNKLNLEMVQLFNFLIFSNCQKKNLNGCKLLRWWTCWTLEEYGKERKVPYEKRCQYSIIFPNSWGGGNTRVIIGQDLATQFSF